MTKAFIAVAGAALLGGGILVGSRLPERHHDDSALRRQVQELGEKLDGVDGRLRTINRDFGAAGARLASAVRLDESATTDRADEPNEERDARIGREIAAHAIKESVYYGKLDEEVRRATPSPERREQLRKNVEELAAAKLPVTIGSFDCSDSLCRVELKRDGRADPKKLHAAYDKLARGMRELTMRPFEQDGRSVIYIAPGTHQLPPMAL
jgi:hypothetical protein